MLATQILGIAPCFLETTLQEEMISCRSSPNSASRELNNVNFDRASITPGPVYERRKELLQTYRVWWEGDFRGVCRLRLRRIKRIRRRSSQHRAAADLPP